MVVTAPTGRTPHETVELHPDVLVCGHPWRSGGVLIRYAPHPDGRRRRLWICAEDYAETWDDAPGAYWAGQVSGEPLYCRCPCRPRSLTTVAVRMGKERCLGQHGTGRTR
jgi:hypothetical protein